MQAVAVFYFGIGGARNRDRNNSKVTNCHYIDSGRESDFENILVIL